MSRAASTPHPSTNTSSDDRGAVEVASLEGALQLLDPGRDALTLLLPQRGQLFPGSCHLSLHLVEPVEHQGGHFFSLALPVIAQGKQRRFE